MAKLTKQQREIIEYEERMTENSKLMHNYHQRTLECIAYLNNRINISIESIIDGFDQYYKIKIPEGSLPNTGEQTFLIYKHLNITDKTFRCQVQCLGYLEEFVQSHKEHLAELDRKMQIRKSALEKLTLEEKKALGLV